jgi:Flp pilus assembly protein TadD
MKRWALAVMLSAGMLLGGAMLLWGADASSKLQQEEKAATGRAAQDYLKYGLAQAGEGRDAEAAKAFRQAIAIRPDWAEAHSLLGSSLARMGQSREAEAEFRKAVTLKPDYAEGWYQLGIFLKSEHKDKEAEEALAKARQYSR